MSIAAGSPTRERHVNLINTVQERGRGNDSCTRGDYRTAVTGPTSKTVPLIITRETLRAGPIFEGLECPACEGRGVSENQPEGCTDCNGSGYDRTVVDENGYLYEPLADERKV